MSRGTETNHEAVAASAVDALIKTAMRSSAGIVALDSTGLESSDSSGYPPAGGVTRGHERRSRLHEGGLSLSLHGNVDNYLEQKYTNVSQNIDKRASNMLVDMSLLQNSAVETPAALDASVVERPAEERRNSNSSYPSQQRRRLRARNENPKSTSSAMAFMTGGSQSGHASQNFPRRKVAIGRKRHRLISNIASFEAFSTSEAEEDIRVAVARLVESMKADQTHTGGPTHRAELWKLIESFFDAIPFVGIEGGQLGQRQFTQYIRIMSALREGIRACMYDNYDPTVDHRTLIPNFSALELARQNVVTLEAAVLEAEKAVIRNVQSTKADVVMAFKQLKPREREELRQYLEKREDFKPPETPKISPFRQYTENKRKGIPRQFGGGRGGRAAARWLLGSGGVVANMKTKKLEAKMQSQYIEIRRLEYELSQAKAELADQKVKSQERGKAGLMDSLCEVLDIDDVDGVHAEDIIGRVKRMRRKNMDRAEELFSMQGKNDPAHRRRVERLVELLDLTTFESGSVEDEIVFAVEKLVRQVKQGGGTIGEDSGAVDHRVHENKGEGLSGRGHVSARTRFKAASNLIRQLGNIDRKNKQDRAMVARKAALQQRKGAQKASVREVRRFVKGKGTVSNDVSLNSLLHGVSKNLGSKNVPSGINVNNTLAALYEAKIHADKRNDEAGKQRMSLAQYLRTFLVHQYGIKKLAMKHMMGIIKAIRRHRRKVPRLNLFARLVGLEESDEHEYSSIAADYFLIVLVELFRAVSVKKVHGLEEMELSVMMQDGITKKKMLTQNQINITLQNIDMGRGGRERIMGKVHEGKSWDVDTFLEVVMESWYESYNERLDRTAQVFFESDENGDGELTLSEFTTAVRILEPHCPDDDIVELYDKIAGDDGVIDAEEFAEGVMLLHSHMISQHRRIREARREANLKAAAMSAISGLSARSKPKERSTAEDEAFIRFASPPAELREEELFSGSQLEASEEKPRLSPKTSNSGGQNGENSAPSNPGKRKSTFKARTDAALGIGF